ncbi:unnamed protein product, partial [Vitis vinifera]
YMRQIVMDQKLNEKPQPTAATVQTDNPTPISLNGLLPLSQGCKDWRSYKKSNHKSR